MPSEPLATPGQVIELRELIDRLVSDRRALYPVVMIAMAHGVDISGDLSALPRDRVAAVIDALRSELG